MDAIKTKIEKLLALFLLFFFSSGFALAQSSLHLPAGHCDQLISHTYYTICYSYKYRQAFWTSHVLTIKSIKGHARRKNNFRDDPELADPVHAFEFRRSGYDRGHLVPAADMKLSKQAMSETFFMSNMSPQSPRFNRGLWAKLEVFFRNQVLKDGEAYLVTAPILDDSLGQIKSGVSVPKWYYKMAYFPEANYMMAYLMPNKNLNGHKIDEFRVSVDDIEAITGYDYYADLPDDLENQLEGQR